MTGEPSTMSGQTWIKMSCGGGRKERRRRRVSRDIFATLATLVYTLFQFTSGFSPPPVPDDCTSQSFEAGIALDCKLSAINSAEEKTNFSVIPFQNTLKLDVSCQNSILVSHLEADAFRSLKFVKHLAIKGCNFQAIPPRSFWGLSQLESLAIHTPSTKSWMEVEVDAFYGIKSLRTLDLSENDIRQLSSNVMCPLNNLRTLNLSKNKLSAVSDIVVSSGCLGKVNQLDLSFNGLTGVDLIKNWDSLSHLILSNNNIHLVSSDAFSRLKVALKFLDLSSNSLASLPEPLFQEILYLNSVNLANNSISHLPKKLFKDQRDSLQSVDVSRNLIVRFDAGVFKHLKKLTKLDLSHNNLEAIEPESFRGLDALQSLNLGFNQLLALPAGLLRQVPALSSLQLSGNMLASLPDNLFAFTPQLSSLLLDKNTLQAFDDALFTRTPVLKVLDLSHNQLKEMALRSLSALQSLSISHNFLTQLKVSALMPSLWRLEASYNDFTNFTLAMENVPALQVIDWSNNQLSSIPRNAFARNHALQAVRLDGNRLERIEGLFQELPNLSWLNVSSNRLTVFDYAMVPSSLKWLDIHQNSINSLDNYFSKKTGLTYVDASFNRLTELGPQHIPDSIETLILNDNRIATLVPYTFFKKQSLVKVDLTLNKLQTIDRNSLRLSSDLLSQKGVQRPQFSLGGNPIKCDCHMSWFKNVNGENSVQNFPVITDLESIYCELLHSKDRSVIPLVDASSEDFLCTYKTHCFALCHCCDYDACDCEMTCPENCTCYHDNSWSKNIAECSSENLKDLPEQLPMDATEIYLDDNDIRELKSHNFIGRKNLKTLYLNQSKIFGVENHTFNGLLSLQELHLEDNTLTKLEGDEFQGLRILKKLYLHNNQLKTIGNATFKDLQSLEILTLHGNKLVQFAAWHLDSNPSLNSVSLTGNRWSCDCKFVEPFQNWMKRNRKVVEDMGSIYCFRSHQVVSDKTEEDTRVIVARNVSFCHQKSAFSRSQDNTDGDGTSPVHEYLPVLITSVSIVILVSVLCAVAFTYRSDLRVWFYTKYGIRFFQRIDTVADAEKVFDAFVAYSGADEVFVRQVLAPELEHGGKYVPYPNRYKLCLFYRDLPPQVCISDLIMQATDASRRTVVVLSDNFLKSEWSRFEFKSGLLQALQASDGGTLGRRKLIFVILGDIANRDVDPELRLYLKSGTVIQWGDKSFWEKLCYLLPDVSRVQPEDTYSFRYETVPRRAYGEEDSTRTMTIHI